jgi:glycosyltransferase involved in cell wall biosynthesis
MKTTIDIVLSYYKGSKYIQAQVESIKKNNLPKEITYRIILINDSANPKDQLFLQESFGSMANIEIHNNEVNLGVIKSFEKGLRLTTAPYVMLCDQDDYWLPHKISASLERLEELGKNAPSLVFTDLVIVNEQLREVHPSAALYSKFKPFEINDSLVYTNIVNGCTIICNQALIQNALPFPDTVTMHDHWLAVCALYLGKLAFLNNATILYRQHSENQVGTKKKNSILFFKFFSLVTRYKKNLNLKALQLQTLSEKIRETAPEKSFLLQEVSARLQNPTLLNTAFLLKKKIIYKSWLPFLLLSLLPGKAKRIKKLST